MDTTSLRGAVGNRRAGRSRGFPPAKAPPARHPRPFFSSALETVTSEPSPRLIGREDVIRSFIALHVEDAALAERLLAVREKLRSLRGLKWVAPHQLHFTLKFLGPIDEERVPAAREAALCAAAVLSPFTYTLEGVGVFPPRGPARTLWAGVTQGKVELVALATAVESSFVEAGFPPESRPFSPHL